MVTLVGTLDCSPHLTDYNLIRHWIGHFKDAGVDRIHVGLRFTHIDHLVGVVEIFSQEVGETPFEYTIVNRPYVSEENDAFKLKLFAAAPGDWIVPADVDEFPAYPRRLPELVRRCQELGKYGVRGVLVDRVRGDGSFPPVAMEEKLIDQFPVKATLVKDAMQGLTDKVVLFDRSKAPIRSGHHFLLSQNQVPGIAEAVALPSTVYLDDVVEVNHYKWTSTVRERTITAMRNSRTTPSDLYGKNWPFEIQHRLVKYMDWGK